VRPAAGILVRRTLLQAFIPLILAVTFVRRGVVAALAPS
jgi:hypothetical protein